MKAYEGLDGFFPEVIVSCASEVTGKTTGTLRAPVTEQVLYRYFISMYTLC